jgi:hypothetical protein
MQLDQRRGQRVIGADDEIGLVFGELAEDIELRRVGFRADGGRGQGRAFREK